MSQSMFSLLTFEVIEKIFDERAEQKTSSLAKMLYLNCLMGRFKGKDATEENSTGFEIFIGEIKNYTTWAPRFIELHKAKLITITDQMIIFHNHWGQFIDRSSLKPKEVNVVTRITPLSCREDLINNVSMFELVGMKNKLNKEKYVELVDTFVKQQTALQEWYSNSQSCSKHFLYWAMGQATTTQTPTTVKSKNKLLGL